ncbi:hypothetical protein GCM10009563_04290 [Subtercola frigoramans]
MVRPPDSFDSYLTDQAASDERERCYRANDVPVETATNKAGDQVALGASPITPAQAVSAFSCESRFRTQPSAPPTRDQLGYLYDYLTRFLAPCYTANGFDNPPPPSREDFVKRWPDQDWYPSFGDAPMGTDHEEAVMTACPGPP